MKVEKVQDLNNMKEDDNLDSSQQLQVIRKEDVIIGDLEEMELTSKNYKIKTKKTKKFCNRTLIRIICLFVFSIYQLYIYILL